ncbi:MAG: endolytic transglycosylase MltG [Solirubrobacteraceae bacterium]|nr:endolytic transglycosylase MltG [Solirubrobacteraceae bacterium]
MLVIVLAAAVLWFLFSLFQPGKGDGSGRVAVEIPQGATARQVGDLLADKDVVSSGFFFDLRARLAGKHDDFKAGRYTLARDMSYGAALDALTRAEPAAPPTVKVTLPEGLTRRDMAAVAKKAGIGGDYLAASKRHKGFDPRDYGAPRTTRTLEGFLFPATYELAEGKATARALVGQQLDAFRRNFDSVSMRAAKRRNLTPYDVLIIASMVEREAQVDKERPLIAAVIYNRLREGMPLGIDATTRYELGVWDRPLRVSELERDTPYNTRTRLGLPPTPIGNPGLASIKAAAKPADVDYLYYVVKPGTCGEHSFSVTDEEFQRDVAAYEAARAKNGGRSPDTCDD